MLLLKRFLRCFNNFDTKKILPIRKSAEPKFICNPCMRFLYCLLWLFLIILPTRLALAKENHSLVSVHGKALVAVRALRPGFFLKLC
jgi:hypothetical protein